MVCLQPFLLLHFSVMWVKRKSRQENGCLSWHVVILWNMKMWVKHRDSPVKQHLNTELVWELVCVCMCVCVCVCLCVCVYLCFWERLNSKEWKRWNILQKKKVKRKYCRKTYKNNFKKVGHERERKRERKAQEGMRPGKVDKSTDKGAPGGKILVLSFLLF